MLHRIGKLLRFAHNARGLAYIEEAARIASTVDDQTLAAIALFDQGMLRCVALDLRRGLAKMRAGADALATITTRSTIGPMPDLVDWFADALPSHDHPTVAMSEASSTTRLDVRLGTYALWLAWTGYFTEAQPIAERIAELAATPTFALDAAADGIADACNALGVVHTGLSRPREATQQFARAREIYLSIGHHIFDGIAAAFELNALQMYEPEQIDARRRLASDAEAAWSRGASGGFLQRMPRSGPLNLHVLKGEWDESYAFLTSPPDRELRRHRHIVSGALGTLAYYRGETAVAWAQVHLSLPDGAATNPGEVFFVGHAPVLQRLAAMLAIDAGDLVAARSWLEAHDRWLE